MTRREELLEVAAAAPGDCYIALNPMGGYRRNASETAFIQAILLDLDPIGAAAPISEVLMFRDRLADFGVGAPEKVTIIDSGRGFQLWLLVEPMPPTSDISSFLRAISFPFNYFRLDTVCSDPCRLARLPGTTNTRTGRIAKILHIGEPQPLTLPERELVANRIMPTRTGHLSSFLPFLTERGVDFLLVGVEEGGRHSAAFAAARSLREAGAPLDLALTFIRDAAGRQGGRPSRHEFDYQVRSAYK